MTLAKLGKLMTGVLVIGCASMTSTAQNKSDATAPEVPKGWFSIPPDEIKWAKNGDGTPRVGAVLFGDPSKHELYGLVVKWPPNTTAKAHSHSDDRYVVVLSGTFYHGHGDKFEVSKLERRTKGTTFSEPANVAHFGATKNEEAVLYFVGVGPDRTDALEK
jgi:quercetin dioxygenase-like cupin family protein